MEKPCPPSAEEEQDIPLVDWVDAKAPIPPTVDCEQDLPWVSAFDRFLDTQAAADTLHFFTFFALFAVVLLASLMWMVYRTGVPGWAPPLSMHATLVHPANPWIVTGLVQPALCGQTLLLTTLISTRTHGMFSESLLAVATAMAYMYTVGRELPEAEMAWLGRLVAVLYMLAWIALLAEVQIDRRPRRPMAWCAGLHTVAYIYTLIQRALTPDEAHAAAPIMLYVGLSFVQCLYIVPMLHTHSQDFRITEIV